MSEIISVLKADSDEGKERLNSIKERAESIEADVSIKVAEILKNVKENGDRAVLQYTRAFDSLNVEKLAVSQEEIAEAYKNVDSEFVEALKTAKENITEFHEKQKGKSWLMTREKGVVMGQTVRGLARVGIYVPGGTAAYPSSVLMNAIPAKVAGVEKIVMVTPPRKDGTISESILVAADIAGVDEIYKAGGAQAVGALAYGTESIKKVDKIVGPGNIFVATAKRCVFGLVDIDMIAGPSEILVVSDEDGDAKFIAADLMSQAEHDKLASATLITTSEELAIEVQKQLKLQVENLSRKEIIKASLRDFGVILLADSLKEAISLANKIAPEHLELIVKDPFLYLGEIKNAGSIFLGSYSPEPLGDYMAGPNHVLPTSGSARFFSPLSVDDFVKKSSYIYYSEAALGAVKDKIVKLAETEGLTAHANSIRVRF